MTQKTGLSALIDELRRRRVFRVAAFYGGIAFVIVQIIDGTFEVMGIPAWVSRLMIIILALGFPVSMVLAWVFDITDEGIVRTKGRPSNAPRKAQPIIGNSALIVIAVVAIIFGIWGQWYDNPADILRESSVAVLPFDNLGAKDQDFFADGLTDDLITELSRVSELRVISRTSVLRYKDTDKSLQEIADELNVGAVLEGTVRRSAGQIRIVAQLIDTKTDNHLWADSYDMTEEVAALFSVQSQVATNIVEALKKHLVTGAEDLKPPTDNLTAYEFVLKGHSQRWRTRDAERFDRSAEFYIAATENDPNYTQAWGYLAVSHLYAYWRGYDHDPTPERLTKAESALRRAVALDPDDPVTIYAQGLYAYYGKEDYDEAQRYFELALALRPHDPDLLTIFGAVRRRQGDTASAAESYSRAIEVDPYMFGAFTNQGQNLLALRDWNGLFELGRTSTDQWPDRTLGYAFVFYAELAISGMTAAQSILDEMHPVFQNDSDDLEDWAELQAYLYAVTDKPAQIADVLTLTDRDGYLSLLLAYSTGDESFFEAWVDSTLELHRLNPSGLNLEYRSDMQRALIHTLQGDNAEAKRLGQKVLADWPKERDALVHRYILWRWNVIQVLIGDLEGALETAQILLEQPSFLNRIQLLNEPWYDPLRQYPGFAVLVNSPGR